MIVSLNSYLVTYYLEDNHMTFFQIWLSGVDRPKALSLGAVNARGSKFVYGTLEFRQLFHCAQATS